MLRKIINRLTTVRKPAEETETPRTPEWATFYAASTSRALERVSNRGLRLETVIDVGASNGTWSQECMRYYPNTNYMLIEAQPFHTASLDAFCQTHPNASYVLAAAGNKDGTCWFDESDHFGGLASNEQVAGCTQERPMLRLDTLMAERKLSGPFLLKLDTHGFEKQILEGAEQMLAHTELAIIEAYLFRLHEGALLSHELCMQMDHYGFQLCDFSEPLWRERDLALWQWDLFFLKKTNPVFASNTYV
ncbi:FkbM family methyltransferase [Megalodesulfovibrio paquesii]